MSMKTAHIGCCIPVVTTIIADLEVTHQDMGVKTMKRGLKEAMETRFFSLEFNDRYTVATFLDPRYKDKFFRYVLYIF